MKQHPAKNSPPPLEFMRERVVEAIRVGDVIPWVDIPARTMWRHKCGTYEVRHVGMMQVLSGTEATVWDADADEPRVTIVALNLTGKESAADLQRLAEVFEVREYLLGDATEDGFTRVWGAPSEVIASRLHAAGWRPGMSAEDAARLLSAC